MSIQAPDAKKDTMSSWVLENTLFNECAAIHARVEHLLKQTSIEGKPPSQLKSAYEEVINTLDAFTNAIQSTDSFVQRSRLKSLIRSSADLKSNPFPCEKWSDILVNKYLESLQQLHRLERKLRYAKEGKELFALPDYRPRVFPATNRKAVVARLLWLMDREEDGKSTFPIRGHERYREGLWFNYPANQLIHLPEDKKWMSGPVDEARLCLPISEEWSCLFSHIGRLTILERNCLHVLCKLIFSMNDTGSGRMKRVRGFTEPATVEAVEAGFKECPICDRGFSDQIGPDLESAMKAICGHYIGEHCLQEWTDTFAVNERQDDVSCPMCRTKLCIGQYPHEIRGAIWEYVEYLRNDPALDYQVDQFLLNAAKEGVRQCYGPELGVMLAKLSARLNVVKTKYTAILEWVDRNGRGESW